MSRIEEDDIFRGGFYTDRDAVFTSLIAGASFAYYVTGEGYGTHDFNGQSYYALSEYDACMGFDLTTVAETADLGSGDVSGYVMQFGAVPEPSTLLLLLLGVAGLFACTRHAPRDEGASRGA